MMKAYFRSQAIVGMHSHRIEYGVAFLIFTENVQTSIYYTVIWELLRSQDVCAKITNLWQLNSEQETCEQKKFSNWKHRFSWKNRFNLYNLYGVLEASIQKHKALRRKTPDWKYLDWIGGKNLKYFPWNLQIFDWKAYATKLNCIHNGICECMQREQWLDCAKPNNLMKISIK